MWAKAKERPKQTSDALTPELSKLLSEYVQTMVKARSIYTVGAARDRAGSQAVRDAHVPLDIITDELRRLMRAAGVREADVERNTRDIVEAIALGRSVAEKVAAAGGPR